MIQHPRAILRLALMIGGTFVLAVVFIVSLPVTFYPRRRLLAWRIHLSRVWGRCLAGLMGMKMKVIGRPPEPPFFLVSNHLGYADIIVLESQVKGFFIAKSEVAGWPVLGKVIQMGNTIFIDQKRRTDILRVLERTRAVLDAGLGAILFPEGKATNGEELLPFRAPLLEVAVRGRIPVSIAGIRYSIDGDAGAAAGKVHWYGSMKLMDHLYRLLMTPGFTATVTFGEERFLDSDRKRLADKLRRAVSTHIEYGEN